MRSFTEILNESKKTYPFKIGVAGELPEGFADKLETSLKKYDISNMSAGKKTPIQERPLDFPQLQNMEVTYFDVEVNYPTTPQVMQEYVGACCHIEQSHVIVRGANDPREEYQETKDDSPYETMLTKEDMGGESAQESVGNNRVMELLKELEKARKEQENNPMESAPVGESKDIDDSENAKSPIGS
jgi:hypothetical protein